MKILKVYSALATLDVYALNKLKKYIQSPYFNSDQRLVELYEFYHNDLKSNGAAGLTEQQLAVVFKDRYDTKLLRRLNSDLTKHLVAFLAQEELQQDKLLLNNLKFAGVGKTKNDNLINSQRRSNLRDLEIFPDVSSEYYYASYFHEKIEATLKTDVDRKKSKSKVDKEINIDSISYHLDQFYIIEKLKLYISLLSWKRSYKVEKEISHIDEIKQILSNLQGKNEVITAYLTIVKTLEEPEKETYFKILRSIVKKNKEKFSDDDFRYIYEALLSYSITAVNKGIDGYIATTLDIYKEALTTEALLYENEMSASTFNNVIAMACRSEDYNWALRFIEDYQNLLPQNTRQNTVSFSMARIQFYTKNFHEVISILSTIEYETVIYNLNSKTMLLFSYYEIGEMDALDSLINSFKVYLNRERSISATRKKRYNQLLSFVKKISTVNPRDKKRIAKIKSQLLDTSGVLNKSWLLEKIEELQ